MLFEELPDRRHEIQQTICDFGQQCLLAQKSRRLEELTHGLAARQFALDRLGSGTAPGASNKGMEMTQDRQQALFSVLLSAVSIEEA